MKKPIIHFAHSNGFPKGSYIHLFEYLTDEYEIIGKEMLAHDDRFAIENDWWPIADEIIDYLDRQNIGKVIGLGHSLGATTTLMAALKRPDLFSSLVLMDPVLIVGVLPELGTELLKKTGLISKVTPAKTSKDRKRQWVSKKNAFEYFKSKRFFEPFTQKSLQAYVDSGLEENDQGFALKYKVETEVKVFLTPVTSLSNYNKTPLQVPGMIIYGETSNVSKLSFISKLSKKHHLQYKSNVGSHMFPLEFPRESANEIKQYLNSLIEEP